MKKNITIIAHRGGRSPHEENTLPAFQHALTLGVNALEMDVRFDYFKRRFFLEHDFFHPAKARLNLFENVLAGIPEDAYLIIELKIARFFSSRFFIRHFVRFYKEKLTNRPILIHSFNPWALTLLRRRLPDAQLGFLCSNTFWNFFFKIFSRRRIKPQSYHLQRRLLNESNVHYGRKRKLKILAFVLNRPAEWDKALELGVDGIITDDPIPLRDYLKKHVKTQ